MRGGTVGVEDRVKRVTWPVGELPGDTLGLLPRVGLALAGLLARRVLRRRGLGRRAGLDAVAGAGFPERSTSAALVAICPNAPSIVPTHNLTSAISILAA